MPMSRELYPPRAEWDAISARIREQAGHRCEVCSKSNVDLTSGGKPVVLTVHHIGVDKDDGRPGDPDDKMDCRDENLILLCQLHHLIAEGEIRQLKVLARIGQKPEYWRGTLVREYGRIAWKRVHETAYKVAAAQQAAMEARPR